ncbi:conserved unknown protein [Nannochloropsis gaditana]|uniref:Uncharacterized protein n=1 Tax=Nannochloropsis gaditana TaxID=72520 RepID=W7T1W2_9STRA|nr:conserved unknown protein [Nannochloropsis gaditana]
MHDVDDHEDLTGATGLPRQLKVLDCKLRVLMDSCLSSSSQTADVEYVHSTLISELEAEHIVSIEDVFSVIQTFVPEEMLLSLGIEDEDDIELFVSKVWLLLQKERVIQETTDDEVMSMSRESGCELCERAMPLTRHHLRPRAMHKILLKQGMSQDELNICAAICRPCHSAVHRTYDNETLAINFYTVSALLADEKIGKFVRWASKQRGREQKMGHNPLLKYQR